MTNRLFMLAEYAVAEQLKRRKALYEQGPGRNHGRETEKTKTCRNADRPGAGAVPAGEQDVGWNLGASERTPADEG
jgi:hypothetical protein